jgi:hypothetical protein
MEDTELDMALAVALDVIDSGMEELQMSMRMVSHEKRVRKALQAQASFAEAMQSLKRLSINIQWQPNWQYWFNEARNGLSSANAWLDELNKQA